MMKLTLNAIKWIKDTVFFFSSHRYKLKSLE